MPQVLFLETPQNFSFRRTVFSHGWCQLLPFELDRENWRLNYVFPISKNEKPVFATMSDTGGGQVKIELFSSLLNQRAKEKILRDARHILRLDDDLSEFYRFTKTEQRLAWISETNAGRLLRSPTVFEDLVKTICTTNCSWALTKNMTTNLVEKLGELGENGKRTFPSAEAMASVSAEFYKKEIRAVTAPRIPQF